MSKVFHWLFCPSRRGCFAFTHCILDCLTIAISSVILITADLAQAEPPAYSSPSPGLLLVDFTDRREIGHSASVLESSEATGGIPLLLFVGESCSNQQTVPGSSLSTDQNIILFVQDINGTSHTDFFDNGFTSIETGSAGCNLDPERNKLSVVWLPEGYGTIDEPLIIIGSKNDDRPALYAVTLNGTLHESFGENGIHVITGTSAGDQINTLNYFSPQTADVEHEQINVGGDFGLMILDDQGREKNRLHPDQFYNASLTECDLRYGGSGPRDEEIEQSRKYLDITASTPIKIGSTTDHQLYAGSFHHDVTCRASNGRTYDRFKTKFYTALHFLNNTKDPDYLNGGVAFGEPDTFDFLDRISSAVASNQENDREAEIFLAGSRLLAPFYTVLVQADGFSLPNAPFQRINSSFTDSVSAARTLAKSADESDILVGGQADQSHIFLTYLYSCDGYDNDLLRNSQSLSTVFPIRSLHIGGAALVDVGRPEHRLQIAGFVNNGYKLAAFRLLRDGTPDRCYPGFHFDEVEKTDGRIISGIIRPDPEGREGENQPVLVLENSEGEIYRQALAAPVWNITLAEAGSFLLQIQVCNENTDTIEFDEVRSTTQSNEVRRTTKSLFLPFLATEDATATTPTDWEWEVVAALGVTVSIVTIAIGVGVMCIICRFRAAKGNSN